MTPAKRRAYLEDAHMCVSVVREDLSTPIGVAVQLATAEVLLSDALDVLDDTEPAEVDQ